MSPLWTAAEAAAATGGTPQGAWAATGVAIDSRSLAKGDLFVALRDRRDGHEFVAAALAQGAAAAVVDRVPAGLAADAPLLIVPDTLAALQALGRAGRERFLGRVLAVTGSVGKTGTKEMLRAILSACGRVSAAEKSFNNHWGVPLTLARLDPAADFAVIEIGMNAPGEIAPLSRLAAPHVGLITTVAAVHMAAFRDIGGIAREKAAIMAGISPGGPVVLNRDIATYPILLAAARRAGLRPIRFGRTGRPEYRLVEICLAEDATTARARIAGREVLYRLAAPGAHLAMNALGALAAAEAAGADLARGVIGLGQWRAPEGRGARWRILLGPGGLDGAITLIDESYNANPAAMAAAFDVFAATRPRDGVGRIATGRRVAFLGDMLELGPEEGALHAALAAHPALARIDRFHLAGPRMRRLHAALPRDKRGEWHESAATLAARAPRLVDAGDVVLVKGSRGSGVGAVVEALKAIGRAEPGSGEGS